MSNGWFCVWRKIEEDQTWSRGLEYRGLMITILQKTNWKAGYFLGNKIEPGQFATSASNLADELEISRQKCQRMLKKVEDDGFIKVENVSNRFTKITVVNWERYQSAGKVGEQQVSNQRATGEQPAGTIEQSNKEIKKQKTFLPPSVEEVGAYCTERNNGIDPQQLLDHYEANGWMRGKTKIKDWKACVRTWENKRNKESKPKQQIVPDWM